MPITSSSPAQLDFTGDKFNESVAKAPSDSHGASFQKELDQAQHKHTPGEDSEDHSKSQAPAQKQKHEDSRDVEDQKESKEADLTAFGRIEDSLAARKTGILDDAPPMQASMAGDGGGEEEDQREGPDSDDVSLVLESRGHQSGSEADETAEAVESSADTQESSSEASVEANPDSDASTRSDIDPAPDQQARSQMLESSSLNRGQSPVDVSDEVSTQALAGQANANPGQSSTGERFESEPSKGVLGNEVSRGQVSLLETSRASEQSLTKGQAIEDISEQSLQSNAQATPNDQKLTNDQLNELQRDLFQGAKAVNTPPDELANSSFAIASAKATPGSTPQTMLELSIAKPVTEEGWGNKVMEKVQWMANASQQRAEIRLDPPDLGPLKIEVTVKNEQAQVTMTSNSSQVRELLEQHLPRLREELLSQGFSSVDAQTRDGQQKGESRRGAPLAPQEVPPEMEEVHISVEKGSKGRVDCYI